MSRIQKLRIGIVLAGAVFASPVVPKEMVLLYSYQSPCEVFDAQWQKENEVTPEYVPQSCTGGISVSVFANEKGEKVYEEITPQAYADMGTRGGYARNPKKVEYVSLAYEFTSKAHAAIAFDAAASSFGSGVTSLTYAHTTTGSDRVLFTGAFVGSGTVTGITYNGSAMTKIDSTPPQGAQELSLWYLAAPSTGANNIVISESGTSNTFGTSASYTGAKQTGIPDASGKANTGAADVSVTVTTVADNSWGVAVGFSNGILIQAGSGTTARATSPTATLQMIGDSNGPKTPAGSLTMEFTDTPTDFKGEVMASFAPSTAAAASSFAPWQFQDF